MSYAYILCLPDLDYDLQVDETPVHLSRHLQLRPFLMACDCPQPDAVGPALILSPRLPCLSGGPLLPDSRPGRTLSPSPLHLSPCLHPSAMKSASFPLPPQPHSGLTLVHRHKASFDFTSLCSNLLSLRSTKNIPQMLPSHHFLALKLAEALNCPQIKSQFLSVAKACG